MATKTYAPQLRNIAKLACRYVVRYRAQIEATINAVITDPTARAKVVVWLDATIVACGVLEIYFPDIP